METSCCVFETSMWSPILVRTRLLTAQARSLRFVDLSDTVWDKKAIDYLVQALNCTHVRPPPVPEKDHIAGQEEGEAPPAGQEASTQEGQANAEQGEREASAQAELSSQPSYGSFVPPAPLLREMEDETKPAAVQSLRMDGCGLRAHILEALGALEKTVYMA